MSPGDNNSTMLDNNFGYVDQWLMFDDHLQRSLEVTPTLDFGGNYDQFLFETRPEQDLSMMNQMNVPMNLEEDFNFWNECSFLTYEDPYLGSVFEHPLTHNNNNYIINPIGNNDNYFLNDGFNDQTLSVVVAEGLKKRRQQHNVGCENSNLIKEELIVVDEDNYVDQGLIKKNNDEIKINRMVKSEGLGYEEIKKCFDMPISKAAKELNVGLTILKKRCRELNIKRWPHRKIKSLETLISNVKEMGMKEVSELLEEHRRKLEQLPELELTAETKRLRQACFKANYKKRRAALLN